MRRSILAASLAALVASVSIAMAGYSGALGSLGMQNSNAVAVTGGTIDGTAIGSSTAALVTGTMVRGTTAVSGGAGNASASGMSVLSGSFDLKFGYDLGTTYSVNGAGWIQSTKEGASHVPLVLNPAGGPVQIGAAGLLGFPKLGTTPTTAPGAGLAQLFIVAGTNTGTCKLQMIAGTSTTPVTIVDNVGAGC